MVICCDSSQHEKSGRETPAALCYTISDLLCEAGLHQLDQAVHGSLLISAADGATLKGIRIGGDLILAPGVTKDVTLVDCVIQGNIRNYGTGEVRFEAPHITPESTATKPSEVYKPGATLDRTLEYGGKTVPIYRDRPLNVFSDVDFIWTDEENENRRRLEYLGGEFRTRYGIPPETVIEKIY